MVLSSRAESGTMTAEVETLVLLMARQSLVVRYTTMAALTWLLWDWLTHLDEEIEHIWQQQWSSSKVLYLVTRYFGISLLIFEMVSETRSWPMSFCKSYFPVMGIGSSLMIFIVEIGMQFRVYALYNRSKWILYFNLVFFTMEVAIISITVSLDVAFRSTPFSPPFRSNGDIFTGCWSSQRPRFTFITWIVALSYELYLFCLVAWKAYSRCSSEGSFVGVLKLIIRDAVIWFAVITALLAWNAFSWIEGAKGEIFVGLSFFHVCASIGGCRLLLNLRMAHQVPESEFSVYVASGMSIALRRIPSTTCSLRGLQDPSATDSSDRTRGRTPRTDSSGSRPRHLPPPAMHLTEWKRQAGVANALQLDFAGTSTAGSESQGTSRCADPSGGDSARDSFRLSGYWEGLSRASTSDPCQREPITRN